MESFENNGLPNDYDTNPNHSTGKNKTFIFIASSIVILLVLTAILMQFQASKVDTVSQKAESVGDKAYPAPDSFNTSDKSITTNGNLLIAVNKFEGSSSGNNFDSVINTTVESISKSPYSAIGKLYKVTGEAYKVEELPPSSELKGNWSEVLMLSRNPNSSVGTSTIDCIFNGNVEQIKPNKSATCTGYFIGTFDSQNAMGGMVESYVFVGYAINKVAQ